MSYLNPQKTFLLVEERFIAAETPNDCSRVQLAIVRPLVMRDSQREVKEAATALLRDDLGVRAVYIVKVVEAGERVVRFEDGQPMCEPYEDPHLSPRKASK